MAAVALLLLASCGGGGGASTGGDAAYQAGPGPQGGAALYADFRVGKKLVLHQRDVNALTPAAFRDRLAGMETTLDAFDGVVLRLPDVGSAVTTAAALSASRVGSELEPLYALRPTRLKYNFAVATITHELDAFDDWTTAVANFATLARVARDAGLVGIVIDNESVAGLRVNYPYDLKFPNRTIEAYRAQTQANSRRVMQAIASEFPDAVVVVLRGPAGAEPASPVNLVNREVDSAQLLGSFFAGFVEGKAARTLLVDGGTDYGLRTGEQFAASAAWRKSGIASAQTNSAFIADPLRAAWPAAVTASFGVRELDGARANYMPNNSALWANTVVEALRSADHMVWASFDLTDMSRAASSNPWVAAARAARAAAASPTGGLGSAAPATGTGLMAQYYSQIDESELAQTLVDPAIDYVWTDTGPLNTILSQTENYSVVWSGYIEAPVTGTYTIFGTTDDGMQIFIGGTAVVDSFYFQAPTEHPGQIDLVAGQRYPIKIRWFQGGGLAEAHVWWQPPGDVKAVVPTERLYPLR